MNKVKYFVFASVLFSLMSCGNSKESQDEQVDATNSSNNSEMIDHPSENLVDFHASSEDWKLSIQFDGELTFTSKSNNINFKGEIERKSVAQGADVVSIYSSNGKEVLRVNIDIVDCKENGKRVDIMHRSDGDKNGSDFSGCGFYRGNPKLHDIWAVKQINGEELNPAKFPKDIPHFEINLQNKQFSGFAGCNEVNGMMRFEYGKMFIEPLSSTKMYCAELSDIENEILSVLRNAPIIYTLKGTNLFLETTKGSITLKKVD
jgi:heat shock protein HslJ